MYLHVYDIQQQLQKTKADTDLKQQSHQKELFRQLYKLKQYTFCLEK